MANTYGTFTSEVLTAGMLNTAGGGWTDYSGTATFTNFTLGDGTINTCRYEQIGRSVKYEVKVTLGGLSSVSGQIGVSLPKTAARSNTARWPAYIVDAGTRAFDARIDLSSTTVASLSYPSVSGATLAPTATSSTAPMTWATGDWFSFIIEYEAAADGT